MAIGNRTKLKAQRRRGELKTIKAQRYTLDYNVEL